MNFILLRDDNSFLQCTGHLPESSQRFAFQLLQSTIHSTPAPYFFGGNPLVSWMAFGTARSTLSGRASCSACGTFESPVAWETFQTLIKVVIIIISDKPFRCPCCCWCCGRNLEARPRPSLVPVSVRSLGPMSRWRGRHPVPCRFVQTSWLGWC